MKQLIRSLTLILLVGGWTLASAAVVLVRTPNNFVLLPKARLGYHETYLDTRKWTIVDDRSHAELVDRLIHMGRADVLSHTVNLNGPAATVRLADAVAHPLTSVP